MSEEEDVRTWLNKVPVGCCIIAEPEDVFWFKYTFSELELVNSKIFQHLKKGELPTQSGLFQVVQKIPQERF